MQKILVLGAGKIGSLITLLLSGTNQYELVVADKDFAGSDINRILKSSTAFHKKQIDMTDNAALSEFFGAEKFDAVISCLPYFLNLTIAELAKKHTCHYFDLTEDVAVTRAIKKLAQGDKTASKAAFVPQCGLAPGMIGIIANSIMEKFNEISSVKMRVGALPENSNNALQYALTWSTDGLINEYAKEGYALEDGKLVQTKPLEGLEKIEIDGLHYEAFNTSGGLGSLAELYQGKVKKMNYKTIRYPGHCEKMKFLMRDLKLNQDPETLKRILENAIPKTYQDIVLIYVSVTGKQNNNFIEENYVKKIYPQTIADMTWSAIQVATATGLLNVLEVVLANTDKYQGFVYQEQMPLQQILAGKFGQYYK